MRARFVLGALVGIAVASGACSSDPAADVAPAQEIVVTKDTRFVGNAMRVGAGELPLPSPLADRLRRSERTLAIFRCRT